jgi:hypothetical protein
MWADDCQHRQQLVLIHAFEHIIALQICLARPNLEQSHFGEIWFRTRGASEWSQSGQSCQFSCFTTQDPVVKTFLNVI